MIRFDIKVINELVDEIKEVYDTGVTTVCGGGNFVRGKSLMNLGIPREKPIVWDAWNCHECLGFRNCTK